MDNTDRPVVSIIMPVYNAALSVQRSLDSILNQSYSAIELLLVNDCSTDTTLDVLERFKIVCEGSSQLTCKIISHPVNRGVAAARNTGLAHASGTYVYYVDADDWIESDTVEQMVHAAQQVDADIVGCNWFLSFERNERKMNQPAFSTAYAGLVGILNGSMRWNLWLFMVKRSLYEQHAIRFTPGMDMGEDLMVMCKAFSNAIRVVYVNKALYHYVQGNASSLTKVYSEKHIQQVTQNVQEVERFLEKSIFGADLGNNISFLKLNIKLPLLISADKNRYRQWINWFPEANAYIILNKKQALRTRILQIWAYKKQFWLVQLYYWLVIRMVYGFLYK